MYPLKQKILFGLVIAGLLFSGYLSAVKLFGDTCAFNESCPYFLGYPACYFGFAMYLTMFVFLLLMQREKLSMRSGMKGMLVVSALGIVFAGYYSAGELSLLLGGNPTAYLLGLPTCAYGLIFYMAIFFVVFVMKNTARK